MDFDIYRYIVTFISCAYLFRIISQYLGKTRGIKSTVFWSIFWIGVAALALMPNVVSFGIRDLLDFKSNVTAIIFVALGLLFIFMFYLSNTVEKLEKQINKLTREMAYYKKEHRKLYQLLNEKEPNKELQEVDDEK